MTRRAPLPTLTEVDYREQGERETLPPPVPIGELVGQMMSEIDGDAPPTPRSAPRYEAAMELVELDVLAASEEADVLVEIGEAYLGRLGGRSHVPFNLKTPEDGLRRSLDPWASFLLSLVDGAASVEDIVGSSAMPEVEALRVLCELREHGFIDVRPQR